MSADRAARRHADAMRRRHPRKPPEQPEPPSSGRRLSQRELEVVQLVADGLDTNEIAKRLWLSPETVKSHLKIAFRIAGITNANKRAALVAWAFRRGLIT